MIPNYPIHNFYDLSRIASRVLLPFSSFYLLSDPFSTLYNLFSSTSQTFWLIEQLNGKQIEVEKIVMATFIVLRGIALRSFAPFSFKKINESTLSDRTEHMEAA